MRLDPDTDFGEPPFASRLEREFRDFHDANPEILRRIIDAARTLKRNGMSRCGVEFIFARLRWVDIVETNRLDDYRLNNNHRAFYARLAMHAAPDLAGFFEVRVQKSAEDFDPATVAVDGSC